MPEITFDPREVNIPSNQKQAVAQNISRLNEAFYQTPVSQGVGEYFPSDSVYDKDIQQTDIFDVNAYRADRQPWYAQVGASLGTAVNEAVLGTVQGLAALGDLPSYEALWNNSATSDEDFHNAVYDWAKNLKESINEEIPIYSGDRFDSGWFWKNLGQTIGSAASFYVPGMGAAKILGRLGEAVKLGTTASKTLQTLGGAAVMRHAENFQEASGMFDSTYQNTVDFLTKKNAELPVEQQLSSDEIHTKAIDLAGEAAASNYKMNSANYVFDVMQMGAILKPKFASKVLGTAERQPYQVLKAANLLPESKIGKLAKWATDPAKGILEAGSEGLEEIVNTVSQFEAERDAKIKSGELKDDGSDFMSRLGKYIGSEELQDSFIWGMVGGAAFKGLALATGTDENRQDVRNKLDELSSRPETLRNYSNVVNEINSNTKISDKQKAEALSQLDDELAFDLGISSRKAGTTDVLLQQLDQPDFQKQFIDSGVTTQEEVSQKIPQLKKKIEQAAYTYDKYFNKFYESPISQLAKNILIDDGIQYEKELHSNLENLDKLKRAESNIINKDAQVRVNMSNPEYMATAQSVAYDLAKSELSDRIKNEPDEDKQRDLTKVYDILNKNSKLIDKSLVVSKFSKNPLSENLAQQYLTTGFNDVLNANIEKLDDTKLHKQVDEVAKVLEDDAKQFVKENKAKATANAKKDRVKDTIEKTKSPEELAQEMEMEAQQEVVEPVQQDEVFIDNEQVEPVNISEEGKVVDPLTTAKEQLANERDVALQQFPQDAEAINTKYEQDVKAVEEAFFQDTKTKEEVSTEKTTGKVELDQNQYDYDKYKEVVTVDEQTEQGISEANADKEVDASGNITYEYNRSRWGHNIAAYLQRLFKQSWDGNVLKREDVDNALNPEFNKEILDYNKYNTGTEVTIEVADDNTIPVYIPGTKEQTTWGTLKKTVDFNENVPLVIKDKDGNKLFYLHSLDWINVDNVFGDINTDKKNLKKIRQHIITLSKKNEVYETSIIERRNGTLFRTKNKQLVNLSEAMPDPNLIIGVGYDKSGNIKIGDNKFQEGEVHVKYTQPGVTYAIVNLNKDFTTAIPVYNEKIADSNIKNKVIDSISAAITVYLKQKELTPQLQQVANTIKEANGIDVTTIEGLEEYMKQFINLYNTGKASLKDLMKEPTFNNGKRHLITIKNKSIEFTSKGSAAYNIQNNEYFDTNLKSLKETLGNMYFQVNINNIDSNKNVTYFNLTPEGVANTESISYKDFVKQHTKTNVLSFEVSPGVWNYTVQPKFTLDFSKILTEEETPEVVETVEPVSPVEPVTPVEVKPTETISAEEKAIRDRWDAATQDIISRYGLEGVKTGEGKETLDESDSQYKAELKALKGIKPKRQYKKTNFDYNSYSPATITPLEESARKYIIRELGFNKQEQLTNFLTREVVKELVKSKAEVIPSQIYAKFATKFNTDLADIEENISIATEEGDQENLAKFEAIKQMIEPIVSNWSLIEKFASYKLARINNIKFDFNDDVDLEMDGYEESERNNWDQHSATVDPKASMSKDMKLFMSDINRKTAEGEIKKTFFGLPDVMDYNEVYNNLQAVTANLKPNLDVLIAAIESNAVVQPWMQDVADKLRKGTRLERNLFVRTMTNHSRQMYSMMYGIDDNGDFSFKIIDSNATSKPKIIREKWLYVAEANKELTKLNEAGEYIFNIGEGTPKTKFVQRFNELEAKPELRTTQNIIDWLAIIGIEINALTANDLRDKKTRGLSFAQQFTDAKGLFLNLKKMVEKYGEASIESDSGLYESTVVQDLSNLEAKYNMQVHSNSFRSGNKQVYSYGKNNYAVNRVRDLKSDKNLLNNLAELPFSKHSTWLQGLQTGTLASNFDISVISLEALNQFGSKQRDNRELHNLTPAEIERAKVGFIQASQRDFSMGKVNKRVITLLYPTTSDKTTPYIIRTEAVDIAMDSKGNITDKFIDDVLYKQLVLPEIERIRNFEKLKATGKLDTLNHAEYEVAGFKFMLLPEINTIPGVFDEAGNLHPDIHTNEDIQKAIRNKIREYVESIVAYKLQNWKKYGIGEFIKDANGKDTAKLNYIDNKYITEKLKNIDKPSRVNAAATDMVVQYLVGNANVFMTIIGDPAQFYKSKSTDPIVQVEDTFINIGKRLAGDIAPRDESVASDTNNYIQAIVADKSSNSILAEELLKLIDGANVTMAEFKAYSKAEKKAFMDKYKAAKYYEFDGTDAQEITTLLERLYMMESYGAVNGVQLPNGFYDVVAPVIKREIDNNNHYYDEAVIEELNKVNPEWVDVYKNLVFQPTKPVYQQNIVDLQLGVERRVYIKSSDYPLVPSATKGFEIDKLRIQMEKAGIARLAFKTAVKVGSVKNTVKIFNEDGTIVDNIDWTNSTLNLPRSGFGYQQEVPYDEMKKAINRVSQASKNLFNNILSVKDFDYKGRKVDGFELQKIYHGLYDKLFKLQKEEFEKTVKNEDGSFNIPKLRELLKEEIQKRDYPISDSDALDLDELLTFMAYSPAADKYESLLNSLVQNRIIKTEFAGKSFVVASEEGWQLQKGKSLRDSGIIFTPKFEGYLKPNQVIIPFKQRDNEGKLLHLEDFVDPETGLLDTYKLPEELLKMLVMRIPNQGLNSQRYVEVVGFLPHSAGDMIICSRDLVVQMGQDFDVDKLYTYMYNTYLSKDGSLSKETKDTKKVLQNEILDIHLAIHANQDERVQKQIVEPLGFWILPDLAKYVSNSRKKRFATSLKFTGLSDEYQKQKFINATAGKSGCLGYGTKVLMYDGSFKEVQDVVVGDKLMGIDSTPRNVLELRRGVEQMYVINQNKGMSYRVNESHILSTIYSQCALYSKPIVNGVRIVDYTTKLHDKVEEIRNIKVSDYLTLNKTQQRKYLGYQAGLIDFPHKEVLIDPYYLGFWLAEGSCKDIKEVGATEPEIIEYLKNTWGIHRRHGIATHVIENTNNINENFKIVFNSDKVGIPKGTKHIPKEYLYNSKEVRLQVLAGLIDGDGFYDKERKLYEISQKYELISNDILYLVRSLGFRATIKRKVSSNRIDKTGTPISCYRITFSPELEIPVMLDRKKYTGKSDFKNRLKNAINVVKDTVDNYYGFVLDGDHLFMLEDFTVTHNTGVFSIDSTFNAIAQGKNLILTSENKPIKMVIGEEEFNGDLSKELALDNKTYKSDIIAGFQSAAVDNEKEQILDKLNINNSTFKAYKFLNQAGFTNGTLLVSQDIIFDYVEELNRLRSEGYTPNIESVAADNVKKKYVSDIKVEAKDLTEAKLKDMIEQGSASENYNAYQKLVLSLFLEADAYGQKIQTVQSAINTDSKGLDKNLFGTIVKEDQVSKLGNQGIQNAESLLGDFVTKTVGATKVRTLVKPTTLSGQAIYYGLYTNNELWNRFFPYQQGTLDKMFTRAEQLFGAEDKTTGRRADFRRRIWNSFKSYLYSNINFGLTEDVDAARERLFKGDNNIGKRLQELQEKDEYANHPLLSRIVVKPGEPVVLKFNAVSKENSSDVNIYVAFIDLLQQEETKEFARDLVVAAYLSGGIQEAIQYIKYIPVSYLHELPFGKELARTVEERLFEQGKYIDMASDPNTPYWMLPNFLVQYAQHDAAKIPNKITDVSKQIKTEAKITNLEDVTSFMLTDSSVNIIKNFKLVPPEFLTIYDRGRKKGTNKNHLYQFTGEYKIVGENSYPVYYKLDNLGTFGYSEYNSNLVNGVNQKSSIDRTTEVKKTPQMQQPQTPVNNTVNVENKQTETFNIKPGGKKELVDALQQITLNSNDPYFKMVAQELIDNSDNLPKDLKLVTDTKNEKFKGNYNYVTNTLSLGKVDSKYDLEQTVLHETLHGLTGYFVKLYKTNKKELIAKKNPELMRALESLNKMFEDYKDYVDRYYPNEYKDYLKMLDETGKSTNLKDKSMFYAATNLNEFITMAMTDPDFQKILNDIKYKGDKSWWETFIDKLQKFFGALGFDIKENSVLATAIDDILFIAKQEPIVEETNENTEGEVIESLSPMTLREYTRMINGNYIYKNNDYTYEIYKNGSQYSLFVSKEGFNKSFPYFKVDLGENIKNISSEEYANSNLRQLERISNYTDMNLKKELIENVFQALNSVGINNLTFNIEQTVENERLNSLLFTSLKNKYSKEKYEVELKNLNLTPTNREYFEKTKELFKTISSITETIPNINLELSNNNVILSLEEISYSPMTNIPSANEVLKQANELNSDGTKKKLAVTDDNYKVMIKRAQKVNFMQPYYKATVKETFGEGVGYKSKKFFYIDMELKNFDNFADVVKLVSDEEVQRNKKICKGR